MTGIPAIDMLVLFIKWVIPTIGVLSFALFLKPKLFMDLEKKLSRGFIKKESKQKSVAMLEKENMSLQKVLIKNSRLVGLLCFILSVLIITKIF